eukprot:GEMP01057323.1.p1 GENE.GEMP01057323.1~~GEMP01057323.1.p1  ORF type:complete len:224 (+),score=47.90 GEMP01057323.1:308-979(+)
MEGSANAAPFARPAVAGNNAEESSQDTAIGPKRHNYRAVRGTGFSFHRVHRSTFFRQLRRPAPDTPVSLSDNDDRNSSQETHKECAAYCGQDSQDFVELPCKHQLHSGCLETLLGQRIGRCPICRGSLHSLRRKRHHNKIDEDCEVEFVGNFRTARRDSLERALDSAPDNGQCPVAVAQLMQLTGLDDATVRKSLKVAQGNCDGAATMLFDLLEWRDDPRDPA